jgi:hypothetical protein
MHDDDLTARFREDLGPDFEHLADLAPVVKRVVDQIATRRVTNLMAPLRQVADQAAAREAEQANATILAALSEKHPDWKDHEEAMVALSRKWSSQGMSQEEYLDHLYTRVTAEARHEVRHEARPRERDTRVADEVSRQEADTRHSAPATIAECFRAAKRGQRWE